MRHIAPPAASHGRRRWPPAGWRLGFLLALVLAVAGCATVSASGPDLSAHAYLSAVALSSPSAGWAVGEDGTILRYAASTWKPVASPTHADLYAVATASPNEAWAVGLDVAAGHGVILHEVAGAWTLENTPDLAALRGITMRSATDGWIVGDGGTILHLVGGRWTRMTTPYQDNLFGVAFDASGTGWAVGYTTANTPAGSRDTSVILRFAGGAWSRQTPVAGTPYSKFDFSRIVAVVAAANGTAWAVGTSGTPRGWVLRRTNQGWQSADGSGTYELADVALATATDGWAVGNNGELLHLVGTRWQEVARVTTNDLAGVALVAPGEGWAVGANGTILRLHNGSWSLEVH